MRKRHPWGVWSAVGVACLVWGCQRPNPAFRPADGGVADTSGGSGGITATGTGGTGIGGGAGDIGTGGANSTGGAGGMDASTDLLSDVSSDSSTDRGPDMTVGACTDSDGDGYGVGTGCMGPDCDDANPLANLTATRACYTGLARTKDVGVCRSGTETCAAGVWSACNGQVLPSAEACNGDDDDCSGMADDGLGMIACGRGACAKQVPACANTLPGICVAAAPVATTDGCDAIDNDCDGATDEDCLTACVRVAPSGDDNGADGSTVPFRNIQAAINWAAMPDHAKTVCIAGGATCQDQATYRSPDAAQALVMSNGISVLGNYESTNWTRCLLTAAQLVAPGPNVKIQTLTATGVEFPNTVIAPTVLDGVGIVRAQGTNFAATAAVTVNGARQVTLSNLAITDAPVAPSSYGINLINGAEATITRSLVFAGAGSGEAVAIRSVASRPIVRDNCGTIDPNTGRCAVANCASTSLALRGRNASTVSAQGSGTTILLKDSPGAIVERNTICGGPATQIAGVRVAGPATGTIVRGNAILVVGGVTEAHGVWMDDCGDAAPAVVDNELVQADAAAGGTASAVRATGACHPVIAGNVKLSGGGEAILARAVGVFCGASGGTPSRCAILGNKLIQGSTSNHPTRSAAVACESGGCVRVARNVLLGNAGAEVVGLIVEGGGPLVERNTITGGCGTSTMGVFAIDSGSRVQNNVIRGSTCTDGGGTSTTFGLHVHVAPGGREIDIHSNTIDAGGAGPCAGAAVIFGTDSPATAAGIASKGVFRNNILRAGTCGAARYGFWEDTPPTSPRVLENSDFDPTGSPTALYLDDNTMPLSTALAINALARTMSGGNISADPMFAAAPTDLHLGAASMCVNTGTPAGAPVGDFDGKVRDTKPDIGAFER